MRDFNYEFISEIIIFMYRLIGTEPMITSVKEWVDIFRSVFRRTGNKEFEIHLRATMNYYGSWHGFDELSIDQRHINEGYFYVYRRTIQKLTSTFIKQFLKNGHQGSSITLGDFENSVMGFAGTMYHLTFSSKKYNHSLPKNLCHMLYEE